MKIFLTYLSEIDCEERSKRYQRGIWEKFKYHSDVKQNKFISCPRQTVHLCCFGNIYQNIKYQSAKHEVQNCESFCTSNMTISIVLQLKEISFPKLCAFLSTSDISYQGSLRKFHLKSMDNHIYDF